MEETKKSLYGKFGLHNQPFFGACADSHGTGRVGGLGDVLHDIEEENPSWRTSEYWSGVHNVH